MIACGGGRHGTDLLGTAGDSGSPSDNIWHFDTECIEDHGDYARIAKRMKILAQGDLPIEDILDYVDVDNREAHLSFRLRGIDFLWQAKVEDDWIDPSILSRFANLLETSGATRRFTYIDLGGQDCLIGCSTREEQTRLQKLTGLKVEWLK